MSTTKKTLSIASLVLIAVLSLPCASTVAGAAGKKRAGPPAQTKGKRVLAIEPIRNVRIEMPDETPRDFGQDFHDRIRGHLDGNRYVVVSPVPDQDRRSQKSAARESWASGYLPSATLRIAVDALSFQTGNRGGRMFYGFNERFRTPFNDGSAQPNEYPLDTMFGEPSWFDHSFDRKGRFPFDSMSGLDLGDGLGINILFAWLTAKYATYHSELHLRVEVDAPLANRRDYTVIQVQGTGYFYDVAGAYGQYNGGIRIARRDAMLQAFNKAIEGTLAAIDRTVQDLPLTAIVDNIGLNDGVIYIGTGIAADIPAGTLYEAVDRPEIAIQVYKSERSGSLGRVVTGNSALVQTGMVLREIKNLPSARSIAAAHAVAKSSLRKSSERGPQLVASESILLPPTNFKKGNLKGLIPAISEWVAYVKSVVETATLPYRIWRYSQYDQSYHAKADSHYDPERTNGNEGDSFAPPQSAADARQLPTVQDYAAEARRENWARQIGLDRVALIPDHGGSPLVAVIDSGIDYNHPAIHDALWQNPSPVSDANGREDRYGWDFISGDGRPFDDSYHGTQLASALLAVAPHARIMPLKIFNPWGITNSAAIYGAFTYAVDHGAKLILCGWSTRRYSKAMEMGVAYARDHGVLVIAAAGDIAVDLRRLPEYPASFARKYENVITVTAVDEADQRLAKANRDPATVFIAAPGKNVRVAEPRNRVTEATSTGIASAIVAGAVARMLPDDSEIQLPAQTVKDLLRARAVTVQGLQGVSRDGARLMISE